MRPVGVTLEVDPVVGADGFTLELNIAPEVTEFEGFINYGSPIQTGAVDALGQSTTIVLTENRIEQPVFSTRKLTTSVTIWDGQTVAIGGLIREDVQNVQDKVPLFGDIPLIGRFFRTNSEQHFKKNLMIFVTGRLIDPAGQPINSNVTGGANPESGPAADGAALDLGLGAGGGASADAGFTVSNSATTVIGFSLQGNYVPSGDGVLVTLEVEGNAADACLDDVIISGIGKSAIIATKIVATFAQDDIAVGQVHPHYQRPFVPAVGKEADTSFGQAQTHRVGFPAGAEAGKNSRNVMAAPLENVL